MKYSLDMELGRKRGRESNKQLQVEVIFMAVLGNRWEKLIPPPSTTRRGVGRCIGDIHPMDVLGKKLLNFNKLSGVHINCTTKAIVLFG